MKNHNREISTKNAVIHASIIRIIVQRHLFRVRFMLLLNTCTDYFDVSYLNVLNIDDCMISVNICDIIKKNGSESANSTCDKPLFPFVLHNF